MMLSIFVTVFCAIEASSKQAGNIAISSSHFRSTAASYTRTVAVKLAMGSSGIGRLVGWWLAQLPCDSGALLPVAPQKVAQSLCFIDGLMLGRKVRFHKTQ